MEIKKFGTQAQAQKQIEHQTKTEGGMVKPNVLYFEQTYF
jgi:hypothetical protein